MSNSVKLFSEIFISRRKIKNSSHSLPSLTHSSFKAWRQRQMARNLSQFNQCDYNNIAHVPVCFELTKGCSVGCWFCGISAPRLSDIFTYTHENASLWREVLELMKDMLGTAAGEGFCYWATDPLDNPDYEKFCTDFYEILGTFPPTTTAQPLKDTERTRALLKLSEQKGCKLNRFSILSLKIFNEVNEKFSAEELIKVALVLQNSEAISVKANAGRPRDRSKTKTDKLSKSVQNSTQTTIACVTGFLFNMVERSVKLISPCPADDRWPNGYIIYDEGTFSDINDLKSILEKMIAKNMSLTVRDSDIIRFRSDLKYESLPDGFQVSTKYLTRKFSNQPYLKNLGEVIQNENKTAREIAILLETLGVPSANTLYSLNFLLDKGILDEEPSANNLKKKTLQLDTKPIY